VSKNNPEVVFEVVFGWKAGGGENEGIYAKRKSKF